jgi:hypothetical protein
MKWDEENIVRIALYSEGVKAAREAIAVSPSCCNCTAPTTTSGEHDDWCMVFKILAAIDGIKP